MHSDARVLITGATGFVGYHLAAALLEQGRQVHLIVRASSAPRRLAALPGNPVIHTHDGTTGGMLRLFEQAAPDIVFHLASLFLAQHRPDDVEPLIRSNILLGAQLLEAMSTHAVPFLVSAGTSWQHYDQHDYRAVCLYAATKQAFEDIAQFYADAYPLRTLTLKLFDTYGPNDSRNKLFALLRQAIEGGEPLAMSPGEQKLDLVYIDDVVQAFLQAERLLRADRPDLASAYGVSSGRQLMLREVAALYERVMGQRIDIRWGGRPYREREVMVPWSGENVPGWQATTDLETGIRRMEGLA
ncbi:MAG: NAD(P)-dependent oxidoreductase [Kouleothrix sp.]|nr:NAD(P)-dependent oxidoreductase [Kouleothrix sp.]